MRIILAKPRGFCAGVTRAIAIVERALAIHGAPVYVRHEIVHNHTIVAGLRAKGAVFIENLDEVPENAVLIFSAHGVPKDVEAKARSRSLRIFDATCPLVTKVHREVSRLHEAGYSIVMVGHAGHPEVEGTMGQIDSGIRLVDRMEDVQNLPETDKPLAYVTQTTISMDDARQITAALKKRFKAIVEPKKDDVCYATQNRQDAVKDLASQVDCVLVIGSATSSNSNRLREVAERHGIPAYLIEDASCIDEKWFDGLTRIGVTSGASAPESLVEGVVAWLRAHFDTTVEELPGVRDENTVFPLPKGLWNRDLPTNEEPV